MPNGTSINGVDSDKTLILGELAPPAKINTKIEVSPSGQIDTKFEGEHSVGYQMYLQASGIIDEIAKKKHADGILLKTTEDNNAIAALYALAQARPQVNLRSTTYAIFCFALITAGVSSYFNFSYSKIFFTFGDTPNWLLLAYFTGCVAFLFNVAVGMISAIKAVNTFKYRLQFRNALLFDHLLHDIIKVVAAGAAAVPNLLFSWMDFVGRGYDPFMAALLGVIVWINLSAQSYRGLELWWGIDEEDKAHAKDRRCELIKFAAAGITDDALRNIILNEKNLSALSGGSLTTEKRGLWRWYIGSFMAAYVAFYAFCFYMVVSNKELALFLPQNLMILAPQCMAITLGVAFLAGMTKWMLLGRANKNVVNDFLWHPKEFLETDKVIPYWLKVVAFSITASLVFVSVGAASQIVLTYLPGIMLFSNPKLMAYLIAAPACLGINGYDFYNFILSACVFAYEKYLEYFEPEALFNYRFGATEDKMRVKAITTIVNASDREVLSEYGNQSRYAWDGHYSGYNNGKGRYSFWRASFQKLNESQNTEVYDQFKSKMISQYKLGADIPESMQITDAQLIAKKTIPGAPPKQKPVELTSQLTESVLSPLVSLSVVKSGITPRATLQPVLPDNTIATAISQSQAK